MLYLFNTFFIIINNIYCYIFFFFFSSYFMMIFMLIIFLIYILNYKHSIDCRATVSRAYPIHLFVVLRILEPQLALPSFPFALLSANKAPAAPQLRLQFSVCECVLVCVCTLGMSFLLLGGCCKHRVATPPELKFPSSDVL